MILVSISILAYGALEHTKACIQSVLENSVGHEYELILTDNGSTDGTAEFFEHVRAQNPERVTVVTNRENLGFAEPNNHALTLSRGEYFITLNNDAKVPRNWITLLLQPFDRYQKAALTGPDGSCCELTHDFFGVPGRRLDYLEGSCLCGRTSILKRHGLFASYLKFAYHEDSDLSLRMQELGYTIHKVPFRIQHVREVTSKTVPMVKQFEEQNRRVMRNRWGAWRKTRKFDYPVLIRRKASSGDVLLASSVIKAVSERCPRAMILVETDFKAIFAGNTRIAQVSSKFPHARNARVIDLNMAYENRPGKHIIAGYAEEALLGPLELRSEFFESKLSNEQAALKLQGGNWIAIHAGPTTWEGKNWHPEKWEKLINYLSDSGWRVLLVGNQGYSLPCHMDLRDKTRVHELGGYLKACSMFIGVDSFPMHLAQAVGTPVVALFGVTSPEFILTLGSKAYPVSSDPSHEFTGMRHKISGATYIPVTSNPMDTISLEQVIETIENRIEVAA